MQTVNLKTTAAKSEARLQCDHDRLLKEVDVLQQRLTHANTLLDSATAERNELELRASKSDREHKLIQEELRILQVPQRTYVWLTVCMDPLVIIPWYVGRLASKPHAMAGASQAAFCNRGRIG